MLHQNHLEVKEERKYFLPSNSDLFNHGHHTPLSCNLHAEPPGQVDGRVQEGGVGLLPVRHTDNLFHRHDCYLLLLRDTQSYQLMLRHLQVVLHSGLIQLNMKIKF